MLSDLGLRKVRASRFLQQCKILDIRVRHFIIILHTHTHSPSTTLNSYDIDHVVFCVCRLDVYIYFS